MATLVFELVQKPPEFGVRKVLEVAQILVSPVICITGFALTLTGAVALEIQPEIDSINVKVAVPADMPTITPELLTCATAGLLLTHVPFGTLLRVVISPTQIEFGPVT